MFYVDDEICITESLDGDKYFLFREKYSDICFKRGRPTEVPFKIVDGQVKTNHYLTQKEKNVIKKLIKYDSSPHNTQSDL